MQCRQCHFENMPGVNACFRCGSTLAASGTIDVHPPRASAWKSPFRRVARSIRHYRVVQDAEKQMGRVAHRAEALVEMTKRRTGVTHDSFRYALGRLFMAVPLSIVPGAGQAMERRLRKIWLHILIWAVTLIIGIFFFRSSVGIAFLSIAVAMHGWIMADAAVPEGQAKNKFSRICGVFAGMFIVYLMYQGVNYFSPVCMGESGIAVEPLNVQLRDTLLCVRDRGLHTNLRRGDLALVKLEGYRRTFRGEAVGQVVGLPGEKISRQNEGFAINGVALDPQTFPVPEYMQDVHFTHKLGPGEYFLTMEYKVQMRGDYRLYQEAVITTSVHSADEVMARAVMLWFPLARRGFLPELE